MYINYVKNGSILKENLLERKNLRVVPYLQADTS
jgi:hypothetical protein